MAELPTIDVPRSPTRHTQNAVSPFRYPGGKAFLSEYLRVQLEKMHTEKPISFVEPFCGGAGAALNLLADGWVDCLHLNDADIRIHSAWKAMLFESQRFIDAIEVTPITMAEWYKQQEIVSSARSCDYSFELGFAAFFMNRATRSGIIEKAGPIGGYNQTGKWKIDARFNREKLASQIEWLAKNRERIFLSNLDALSFITKTSKSVELSSTLFFIDPPYVQAGGRLYFNGMTEAKHVALSDILVSGNIPHWVLTYDDAPLIRELYRGSIMAKISVNYSLQSKRKESELLVLPG